MTIGSLGDIVAVSYRDGSNDLSDYPPSSGNFCGNINYARRSINHISVAACDYPPTGLELMIDILHASDFAHQVPLFHLGPDLACQFSTVADLFIEEDLKATGCSLRQQVEDFVERVAGDVAGFMPAKISSRVSEEAIIAKIDRKASQKALCCDQGVVAVHKYRSAAQSFQPQGFGHPQKSRICRDYAPSEHYPLFFCQPLMIADIRNG